MDIQIQDFFKPINLNKEPSRHEYTQMQNCIQFAETFSMSTYQSLYIIDYYRRGFAYVSDNPLLLCGNKPSVVRKMGYSFYFKYVPENDLEMLLEINTAGFKFYNDIPVEKRKNYSISYDFNLMPRKGRKILINHKLTPLLLDDDSNIWLALCAVSLSSNPEAGNIVIRELGSDKVHHYDLKSKTWKLQSSLKISRSEKEMLMSISQGYSVDQIAKRFGISSSTVKFHRQNILRKLNVRNISEALSFAT